MTGDETGTSDGVPADETGTSDGPTAEETGTDERSLLERIDAFPWGPGVALGVGSFFVAYLALVAWVFLGPASLPGSPIEQLKRTGFLLFNAQGVLVVADTPPDVVALPVDLLSRATLPIVYRAVPAVVLFAAGAVFTYRWWVDGSDGLAVLGAAVAIALGYLAVSLVSSYVFVIVQEGVPFHADRIQAFLYVTGYGLVFSLLGSMVVRARGKPA